MVSPIGMEKSFWGSEIKITGRYVSGDIIIYEACSGISSDQS